MDPLSRRSLLGGLTTAAVGLLAGCTSSQEVSTGHLFVENRSEEPRRIAVQVTGEGDDGNQLVNDLYRVPGEIALQFEGVLESGTEYLIRAVQPDALGPERIEQLSITAQTCADDDSADKIDVSIIASSDSPDIIVFECDRTYRYLDDIEYVDPSEYRIRAVTETITTSSPT